MSKSLAKNATFNIIYKLFNVLFPLITSMYVSRILMPAGIGRVEYAKNIVTYFVSLAALGIPNYGIREIAKTREEKQENQRVFCELFVINAISTLIFCIAYYSLIFLNNSFVNTRPLNAVVGIILIFNFFNIDWFYQGHEQYAYIAIRNIIVKSIALICILLFVRNSNDTIIYALILASATVGNYVFNFVHLRHYVKFTLRNLSIKRHLKPVFVLLASAIAVELYTLLDTTMLGVMCDDTIVGYYSNSAKMIRMITTFLAAIGAVLLPRLSYYYNLNQVENFNKVVNKAIKILCWITVPSCIGVYFIADDLIVILFGTSFAPAANITKILTPLIFAVALNNLFGTQILITLNREKYLLFSVISGALSNMVLNYFLIPRYQAEGAALASAISETLVLILTFLFARKYIKFDHYGRFFATILISVILMSGALLITSRLNLNIILSLLFDIIIGSVTYFISNALMKNEVIKWGLNLVIRRIKHE